MDLATLEQLTQPQLQQLGLKVLPNEDFSSVGNVEDLAVTIQDSSIYQIRDKLEGIFNTTFASVESAGSWLSKLFYLLVVLMLVDAALYEYEYFKDDESDNNTIHENVQQVKYAELLH